MKIFSIRLKTAVLITALLFAVLSATFVLISQIGISAMSEKRLVPIYRVDKATNEVAVTFNCANGTEDIDSILATLGKHNVTATFFMLGLWAEAHPQEVLKIYESGHEIGNHSYSHKDPVKMTTESVTEDIEKCNSIVKEITGISPEYFRAPSGSYDNKTINAAKSLGMTVIQWDTDSVDWKNISSKEIIKRVTSKVKSGSVIQLHTGTEHTADSLDEILTFLDDNGFECVSVGNLLYKNNYSVDSNGVQRANINVS